jgi:hypothetical protein
MVKAIKRGKSDAPVEKKKTDRKMQILIIIILVLLVAGWSVGGIIGFAGDMQTQQEEPETQGPDYGVGIAFGEKEGNVTGISEHKAVFGQLNVPDSLAERLDGDLYLLDNGVTHVILTDAEESKIDLEASGNYIIYDIADCGGFDCLVQGLPNGTFSYKIYQLDKASDFLSTSQIGIMLEPSTITI